MAVIKKIGILSFAKIYSLLLSLVGLFEGTLLTITQATNPEALAQSQILSQIGYAGIIVFPIVYALLGFFLGIILAWFYNLFSGWVGGVEFDLVLEKRQK